VKLLKIIGSISVLTALSGCLMTQEDIQAQEEQKQLKDQVSSIQRTRADADQRNSDFQSDLRVVAGRVETLEHNQQVSKQSEQADMSALKKTIDTQGETIKQLEQHLDATEAKLMAAIQAVTAAPAPLEKASTSSTSKKGESLFSEGEALFAKKEFKKALVKYQTFREKSPKAAKASEATYKIGVCLTEIGLKKEAKEIFQETIDNYPSSPSAKKAKFRISQLK
jgi:TolA-binding protein